MKKTMAAIVACLLAPAIASAQYVVENLGVRQHNPSIGDRRRYVDSPAQWRDGRAALSYAPW